MLAIDQLQNIPFVILGDMFLTSQTVVFDKTNNRIGFLDNHMNLVNYLESGWINVVLNVIQGILVILIAALLLCKSSKGKDAEGNYGGRGILLGESNINANSQV